MDYKSAQKQVITIAIITAIMLVVALTLTSCGTLKEPIEMKYIRATLEEVQPIIRRGVETRNAFIYRGDDRVLYYFIFPEQQPYTIGQTISITVKR